MGCEQDPRAGASPPRVVAGHHDDDGEEQHEPEVHVVRHCRGPRGQPMLARGGLEQCLRQNGYG